MLIKNLYSTSTRYLFCLSEGILVWIFTLVRSVFRTVFSKRTSSNDKTRSPSSKICVDRDDKYISNKLSSSGNAAAAASHHYRHHGESDENENEGGGDEFSLQKCKSWFTSNVIHSENPTEMDIEDVIRFFHDELSKELEDVVLLVLAYKMNASRVGFFTQEEWLQGMKELRIDSSSKLLQKWEWLRSLLDDNSFLRSVYRFSFKFSRSPDRRNLEMDLCQELIRIFFQNRWSLADSFTEYLNTTKYPVMTQDEFCSVYEFQECMQDDLSSYDFEGAWPILMDEFVVYMRAKTNK